MSFTHLPFAALALLAMSATSVFANDADFKMVNRTGYQIDSVYVSCASSKAWGGDIMGRDALADGESMNISFPHGGAACNFDIKVGYNGDSAEWGGVNLCQYSTISLFWDGKATRAVGE